MNRSLITAQRLREVLHYNLETGIFTWLIAGKRHHKGDRAGTNNNGYLYICIDGIHYRTSRLAFLWMKGKFPKRIEHINHDPTDSCWTNLYEPDTKDRYVKNRYNDLTANYLRQILHYNPETGIFTWLINRRNRTHKGDIARTIGGSGYPRIYIDGLTYQAARLAWLYMTGEFPEHDLDHINTNKLDNRWCNLRKATSSQNGWNRSIQKNKKVPYKGVWMRGKKFQATIKVNGVGYNLGVYDNAEDAHAAYVAAARKFFGEFARGN